MKASIIIPTFNRSTLIKKLILELLPEIELLSEIIICDDGSNDDTRNVVYRLMQNFPIIKYFWQQDYGFRAGAARNMGIKNATGDIIIFLDDDISIPKNFVRDHLDAHNQRPKLIVIGTRNVVNQSQPSLNIVDHRIKLFEENPSTFNEHIWYYAYSCNLSITNCSDIVLFDEDYNTWGNEDIQFGISNWYRGFSLEFHSEIISFHNICNDLRDPFQLVSFNKFADFTSYIRTSILLLEKNSNLAGLKEIIYTELMYFYYDNTNSIWAKSNEPISDPIYVIRQFNSL